MNNHSPIRTAVGKGKSLGNKDTEQKKKPKLNEADKGDHLPQVELDSPTSVSLQNSFVIKNAGTVIDGNHKA